jgi:hypothetical protein
MSGLKLIWHAMREGRILTRLFAFAELRDCCDKSHTAVVKRLAAIDT